jgi:Tol biopolymer transport system component
MSRQISFHFSRWGRLLGVGLVLLTFSLTIAPTAYAMLLNYKISGVMPDFGSVGRIDQCTDWLVSPDGNRVFYLAIQETAGVFELFSAPIAGGTPVKLNAPLVSGGNVDQYQISPDSAWAVYRADQQTDWVYELYSVPAGGGAAVRLNGDLVGGGDVYYLFAISPDNQRGVYVADQDTDEVFELYSVPIGGGTPVRLNGPLVSGGDVLADYNIKISADSSRVVYRADQDTNDVFELYSVPIGGGAPIKLNGALASGGDVWEDFRISPDGSRVVYRADQQTDQVFELFSVPVAGGTVVKLNGPLAGQGVTEFKIAPNGSRVAYRADQDTDDVFELYSAPVGGGPAVKLNGALAAGGNVNDISFEFSPDSSRVIYQADQETDDVFELYVVPAGGGAALKLNSPLDPNWDMSHFKISPDGAQVIYRIMQDVDPWGYETFSVPIVGGTAVQIDPDPAIEGLLEFFSITPDSSRLVYTAYLDDNGSFQLYSMPIGGGDSVRLNGPLVQGGSVSHRVEFSPDSTRVVYCGDQELVNKTELFGTFYTPVDLYLPFLRR